MKIQYFQKGKPIKKLTESQKKKRDFMLQGANKPFERQKITAKRDETTRYEDNVREKVIQKKPLRYGTKYYHTDQAAIENARDAESHRRKVQSRGYDTTSKEKKDLKIRAEKRKKDAKDLTKLSKYKYREYYIPETKQDQLYDENKIKELKTKQAFYRDAAANIGVDWGNNLNPYTQGDLINTAATSFGMSNVVPYTLPAFGSLSTIGASGSALTGDAAAASFTGGMVGGELGGLTGSQLLPLVWDNKYAPIVGGVLGGILGGGTIGYKIQQYPYRALAKELNKNIKNYYPNVYDVNAKVQFNPNSYQYKFWNWIPKGFDHVTPSDPDLKIKLLYALDFARENGYPEPQSLKAVNKMYKLHSTVWSKIPNKEQINVKSLIDGKERKITIPGYSEEIENSLKGRANYQGDHEALFKERLVNDSWKKLREAHNNRDYYASQEEFLPYAQYTVGKIIQTGKPAIQYTDDDLKRILNAKPEYLDGISEPQYNGITEIVQLPKPGNESANYKTLIGANKMNADVAKIHEDTHMINPVPVNKFPSYYNNDNYLMNNNGAEMVARGTQLKNYFGLKSGEEFTEDMLKYAAKHYIQDTGFDNNMVEFFNSIAPDKWSEAAKWIDKHSPAIAPIGPIALGAKVFNNKRSDVE